MARARSEPPVTEGHVDASVGARAAPHEVRLLGPVMVEAIENQNVSGPEVNHNVGLVPTFNVEASSADGGDRCDIVRPVRFVVTMSAEVTKGFVTCQVAGGRTG